MNKKNTGSSMLGPGYLTILVGSIVDNFFYGTQWFLLGSLLGFIWLVLGLGFWYWSYRELQTGQGFMLVQSGPFAWTRNPMIAAHILGIMPGLCLLLNTNLGILGLALSVYRFYQQVDQEEQALEEFFGETYVAYKERVGRLVPYVFF